MPLVNTGDIVGPAASAGRGAGSFNVILLEHATAIVTGAEKAGAPVILQISENCVRYHGAAAPIISASLAVARSATIPVAVHLDHATSPSLVREAVDLGVTSVMFDASTLSYSENVEETAAITSWCHSRNVWVEAELGEVGGKDGVHAPGVRTDPTEAATYVRDTNIDALAVAVGSSHAMLTRDAVLDLDLIERLRGALPVPLVLHGSSGVPDETLTAAVTKGMTKINIATHLNKVFTAALRETLTNEALVDPRKYLTTPREALAAEVTRLLGVLNAA